MENSSKKLYFSHLSKLNKEIESKQYAIQMPELRSTQLSVLLLEDLHILMALEHFSSCRLHEMTCNSMGSEKRKKNKCQRDFTALTFLC